MRLRLTSCRNRPDSHQQPCTVNDVKQQHMTITTSSALAKRPANCTFELLSIIQMACDGAEAHVQSLLSTLELVLQAWDRQIWASREGLEAVTAAKLDEESLQCNGTQAAELALLDAMAASKEIEQLVSNIHGFHGGKAEADLVEPPRLDEPFTASQNDVSRPSGVQSVAPGALTCDDTESHKSHTQCISKGAMRWRHGRPIARHS